jgi:hypothetical protein
MREPTLVGMHRFHRVAAVVLLEDLAITMATYGPLLGAEVLCAARFGRAHPWL